MEELVIVGLSVWIAPAAAACAIYGVGVANRTVVCGADAPEVGAPVAIGFAALCFAAVARAAGLMEALSLLTLLSVLAYLAAFDIRFLAAPVAPILLMCVAGLAFGFAMERTAPWDRIFAMIAGWLCFSALGALYRRLRGRSGLGEADALVAALIGAWLSYPGLAWSVAIGGAVGVLWALVRGPERALPFIPPLFVGVAGYLLGQDVLG